MSHRSFEEVVLPHLDAAFNYARWLTKNEADAEDVVQDASLRALRFFSSLRGECSRVAAHDCSQHLVWTVPTA
jgi:RNA polymerase sigma-70 factor (ECF subfamily)